MGLVWKVVAVALGVVAAGVVAVFVVFPDALSESLSVWVPRPQVQDGPHFLLELDVDDLRRQRLNTLREEVRRALPRRLSRRDQVITMVATADELVPELEKLPDVARIDVVPFDRI